MKLSSKSNPFGVVTPDSLVVEEDTSYEGTMDEFFNKDKDKDRDAAVKEAAVRDAFDLYGVKRAFLDFAAPQPLLVYVPVPMMPPPRGAPPPSPRVAVGPGAAAPLGPVVNTSSIGRPVPGIPAGSSGGKSSGKSSSGKHKRRRHHK